MHRGPTVPVTAFVLLSLNFTSGTAQAQPKATPADRIVALDRMSHWRQVLEKDPDFIDKTYNLDGTYIDIWATLDLDEAAPSLNPHIPRRGLLYRLAYAGRWDDITRLSADFSDSDWMMEFWSNVANYAASQGDMGLVEYAGKQVEENGHFAKSARGGPPRPKRELISARFFIATARLELLRKQETDRVALTRAVEDLLRVAGSFRPRGSNFSPWIGELAKPYATLDSWMRGGSSIDYSRNKVRNDKAFDSVQPLLDKAIQWPRGVQLPPLDGKVTDAWLQRQILLENGAAALSYLLRAEGDATDRGRLFAICANRMAERDRETATRFATTAEVLLDSMGEPTPSWPRTEAYAELALALHRLGRDDEATNALQRSVHYAETLGLKFDSIELGERPGISFVTNNVMLIVASELGWNRDDLPKHVYGYLDGMTIVPASLYVRGVNRFGDFTKLIKTTKPVAASAPEYRRYYELEEQENWTEALAEAERLAEGNSAWRKTYANLGASYFYNHGLKETLEWTATIQDRVTQLSVELGAIKAALEPDRRRLSSRNASAISSIAPAISWPSGC